MAINKINNGDSGSIVRQIINSIIDLVNGFTATINSLTQRIVYLEKITEYVIMELIGEQDDVNKKFDTIDPYVLGSSNVYVNGARMFAEIDYVELDEEGFEFVHYVPKSSDVIIFECIKK